MLLLFSSAWLAVVVWLIARAWRQRGVLAPLRRHKSGEIPDARICVIVPARDERENIAVCLRSILAQTIAGDRLGIVVVDDASTDDTAKVVAAIAADHPAVSLIRNAVLPPGWKGKPHACWLGARAAPAEADWLCFLDADMEMRPALLASAIGSARDQRLDLLSLAPTLEMRNFAERLILPCGLCALAFVQDLGRAQAKDSDDVVATGQFMLVRRDVYERIGGHAAVSTATCEDVELARLVKRRGYQVAFEDGSELLVARMYTGWRTLWPGFAKNAIEVLGGPARTTLVAVSAIVLGWTAVVLPALGFARCISGDSGACLAAAPAFLASAAAFAFHIAGAIHFGIPLFYGILFPLGYTAGAAIAFDSLRWRLTGRVYWKGRVYR